MGTKTVYYWCGRHPISESVLKHPPEGFQIRSNMNPKQFDIIGEYERGFVSLKKIANCAYSLLKIPRVIYIREPCDLIHASSGVIPLNKKPFIIGVEHASSFVGLQEEKMKNPYLRKVANYLSSDHCKRILPFSEASKKSIENAYNPYLQGFAHKLEVLYPAIEAYPKVSKSDDKGPVRLLHISSHFFDRGGKQLVEAFEILEKKYDLELYMIVGAPKHHQNEFKSILEKYRSHPKIHMTTQIFSRKTLFARYYSSADIFVQPTFIDFFGFVFLEAMSAGLPLIGSDSFAIPEIIEEGVNGFLVHTPISTFDSNYLRNPQRIQEYRYKVISNKFPEMINQLVDKLSILIEDDKLRKKMGEQSRMMVENGKFSIAEQQRKLKKIYSDALNDS